MGYTKEVYDKVWEQLDCRRARARELAQTHRDEVYRSIPEVARIEREIAGTAARVAKTILSSPDRAGELVEELGRQNLAFQRRRTQLLEQGGYPPDYLQEQYTCGECRDTGYVGAQRCSCLQELLRREAYAQLGQVSQAQDCVFANFRLDVYPDRPLDAGGAVPRERMAEILEVCQAYASGFHQSADSLLLLGQTGLGKTHLSLAIARTVTEAGFGVVYSPVQRLMDKLEAEKFGRRQDPREQYPESLRHILECDLLVLDDLGTEFTTSFTTSVLFNIINSRLVERRPTVLNTNLDMSAIEERYSQRMASRLLCSYKVLKFYGKDVRYMKKMQSLQ